MTRPTKQTVDGRIEHLETSQAATKTAISYLRWFAGMTLGAILAVSALAYGKADKAGIELSTDAKVRFATSDEQYKQIQTDLKSLDGKIDRIRDTLDEMKGGPK